VYFFVNSFFVKEEDVIVVNGKEKEFPGEITVQELLALEGQRQNYVAVELDEKIIPREEYDTVKIKDGAQIEIVSFMGGGQ
jgi:sulfur carrier protein